MNPSAHGGGCWRGCPDITAAMRFGRAMSAAGLEQILSRDDADDAACRGLDDRDAPDPGVNNEVGHHAARRIRVGDRLGGIGQRFGQGRGRNIAALPAQRVHARDETKKPAFVVHHWIAAMNSAFAEKG